MKVDVNDLVDLPEELLREMGVTNTDRRNVLLLEIMKKHEPEPTSINQLLLGIYKETGEIEKRSRLIGRMYRLARRGAVSALPGKKGLYRRNQKEVSNGPA